MEQKVVFQTFALSKYYKQFKAVDAVDMTIYEGVKPKDFVTLTPGMMVIFFPQDGHAPCIIDEPEIKKAIFKVKV